MSATTTLPFSYVNWYINGAYETTDYAASDTQTTSHFSHDYAGLGSESGSEVEVKAEAVHRTLSSSPSDSKTATVTVSMAPVPQAYPIILVSADCGQKFPLPDEEQCVVFMEEMMTLEVTPSSWGDAMESYSRAYMWMASVDMSIFKFRPDGTIHVLCHLVCVEEFHEGECESLRPDLPPGKEDSSSLNRTVTVRVKQKDGGGVGGGVNVAGTGVQGRYNTVPGAHDLEFWHGSPITLDTIVLKGRGTYEGNEYLRTYGIICPLTIDASTSGRASAEWYEKPGVSDSAPADGEIAPAAWASHYSPDGTDENERCRKSLDQLGELP